MLCCGNRWGVCHLVHREVMTNDHQPHQFVVCGPQHEVAKGLEKWLGGVSHVLVTNVYGACGVCWGCVN